MHSRSLSEPIAEEDRTAAPGPALGSLQSWLVFSPRWPSRIKSQGPDLETKSATERYSGAFILALIIFDDAPDLLERHDEDGGKEGQSARGHRTHGMQGDGRMSGAGENVG